MNDKKILSITVGEFIEALREGLGLGLFKEEGTHTVQSPHTHYIYGMQALADLLGCSIATAHRIKKSGVINEAIAQFGKVIVIDADLALDLLRVKSHKHNK